MDLGLEGTVGSWPLQILPRFFVTPGVGAALLVSYAPGEHPTVAPAVHANGTLGVYTATVNGTVQPPFADTGWSAQAIWSNDIALGSIFAVFVEGVGDIAEDEPGLDLMLAQGVTATLGRHQLLVGAQVPLGEDSGPAATLAWSTRLARSAQ